MNHVWKTANQITSFSAKWRILLINRKNGWISSTQIIAANILNVTCTVATCFWALVPKNQTIMEVNDVPIWDPNIRSIPIGSQISHVLTDVIVIALVALLDCKTIVKIIPRRINHACGILRYLCISKTSCNAVTLSFIISKPNNNNQNQKTNNARFFRVGFLLKRKIENHAMVITGNANAAISILNPRIATNQDVIVVPILAHIIAQIPLDNQITFAPTNQSIISVTTVLLWIIPVTRALDNIHFNGVFVVVRRNFLSHALPTCLILSEKRCIPKRNNANQPRSSRQEKVPSM